MHILFQLYYAYLIKNNTDFKKVFLIFYEYLFKYIKYKNKIYEVMYYIYACMLCCTLCYTKRTENVPKNILFIHFHFTRALN